MLNLQELEASLDKALSLETPETLTAWLLSKRFNDFQNTLGKGKFVEIDSVVFTHIGIASTYSLPNSESLIIAECDCSLAA